MALGADDLFDLLSQHRLLGDAPAYELRYLIEHGEFRHTPKGTFYIRKGSEVDLLWIMLRGHMAIYVDRGLGPRRVMEWRGGDVSGAMPYSRIGKSPGDAIALEASDNIVINRSYFPDLIRECPAVTAKLVHAMIDRARAFTSSGLQDEKMVSLGRIAAGLAHELNNPASAVKRTAQLLSSLMDQGEEATRVLAGARLTEGQLDAIDRARRVCRSPIGTLSPLERSDREEELADWLSAHDADPDLAGTLMDTGATPASLDELYTSIDGPAFNTAVRWIASCCSIRSLAAEIATAASRMHELVSAIKRFSYMDQTQAPEPLDLTQGLRDSIALLQHKARTKSVAVMLKLPESLPRVTAIGSDLNQVWTNLIDNALDAAPPSGHVEISAVVERNTVSIQIADDGPGIPNDIRERIFDAFFTTKGVGKGTGLGLEITRRLVTRNGGDIELDSVPGRTEFRVVLKRASDAAPAAVPASSQA